MIKDSHVGQCWLLTVSTDLSLTCHRQTQRAQLRWTSLSESCVQSIKKLPPKLCRLKRSCFQSQVRSPNRGRKGGTERERKDKRQGEQRDEEVAEGSEVGTRRSEHRAHRGCLYEGAGRGGGTHGEHDNDAEQHQSK